MARLDALPEQAIISAMKGTVDYYLWRGIPCARMWPRWPKRDPHPDEKANQDAFAYVQSHLSLLPDYLIDQYKRMAVGTPWTWRDLLLSTYMKGVPT